MGCCFSTFRERKRGEETDPIIFQPGLSQNLIEPTSGGGMCWNHLSAPGGDEDIILYEDPFEIATAPSPKTFRKTREQIRKDNQTIEKW